MLLSLRPAHAEDGANKSPTPNLSRLEALSKSGTDCILELAQSGVEPISRGSGRILSWNAFGYLEAPGSPLEPASRRLLDLIAQGHIPRSNSTDPIVVGEFAAGAGEFLIQCLKSGRSDLVAVYNDISVEHGHLFYREFLKLGLPSTGGGLNPLLMVIASFPTELADAAHGLFGAIRIARHLHFLNGPKIREALYAANQALLPGGYIAITATSPNIFRDGQQRVDRNRQAGYKWPGYIPNSRPRLRNPSAYPNQLHLFDSELLGRELKRAGFEIVSGPDLSSNPEVSRLFDSNGNELIGVLARKIKNPTALGPRDQS